MPRSGTLTVDFAEITSVKHLATLIALGHHANPGWQAQCEVRARQLDAEHLIPASWGATPVATRPAAGEQDQTVLLDEPAHELLDNPERHADLDRVLRTLARSANISYADALGRFTERYTGMHELMKAEPDGVRRVLSQCGAKALDAFEGEVRMLEERDDVVARTLDADLLPLSQQAVDAQGRVQLDQDFDLSAYLHDDERRERNWRRARELSPHYAERDRWEQDELMFLEAGCDLLAGLERPEKIAQAHAAAGQLAERLDGIIQLDRDQARRARELDQAIAGLSERRAKVTSAASEPDRPARGKAPRFVDLTASEMTLALERYDEGGVSLDEAAAQVAGIPVAPTGQDADLGAGNRTSGIADADAAEDRAELHQRILQVQAASGLTYLQALEKVANAGPGVLWPKWNTDASVGR